MLSAQIYSNEDTLRPRRLNPKLETFNVLFQDLNPGGGGGLLCIISHTSVGKPLLKGQVPDIASVAVIITVPIVLAILVL